MSTQRPKIIQLIPITDETVDHGPVGFFGLDASGGIWRTAIRGSDEQCSVHWIKVQEH